MAKKFPLAPTSRRRTLNDVRALAFERGTFWIVPAVAVVAAIISFTHLTWLGEEMRWGPWIAPLLPAAIDGLGIVCSFGIVRSQASGEPLRRRLSEWGGLILALGLSIAGNVAYVLDAAPDWLKIITAASIPVVVAYSIHILGRANSKGLSARIYADDPDGEIQLHVPQVGADETAPGPADVHARPVARARATPAQGTFAREAAARDVPRKPAPAAHGVTRGPTRAPSTVDDAHGAVEAARAQSGDDLVIDEDAYRTRYEELYRAELDADPYTQPVSKRIYEQAGQTRRTESAVRRWGTAMWAEHQERMRVEATAPVRDDEAEAPAVEREPARV